jgi:hypothetical protein
MVRFVNDAVLIASTSGTPLHAEYSPPHLLRLGAVTNLTDARWGTTVEANGSSPSCAMMGIPTALMRRPC